MSFSIKGYLERVRNASKEGGTATQTTSVQMLANKKGLLGKAVRGMLARVNTSSNSSGSTLG